MSEADERSWDRGAPLNRMIEAEDLFHSGGSVVLVTGRLYRAVQVKHPRNARFSLQNERGLFFVKVQQASLVAIAQSLEAGTELAVLGEMYSFVSRRCRNHHVFIKAQEILPLTETSVGLTVKAERE